MTTFNYSPATNVCSDVNCVSFVATADSAIACTEYGLWSEQGWPSSGGQIAMTFYGKPCPGSDIPSLSMCFPSTFNLAWCAPLPEVGANYDPYTFKTKYGYFSTPTSQQGTAQQLRWHATLTNATKTNVTVQLNVESLNQVAGDNVWTSWLSGTYTLPITSPYQRNDGNAFIKQYIPISVQNPNCEVYFMTLTVGLQPLRIGCGVGPNDYTCGLYNGENYITCARGLLKYKNGNLPVPFLFGLNGSNCSATSTCNCDQCEVTTTFYSCLFNSDIAFYDYVLTNFGEPVNAQQSIQVATGAPFPIMLKYYNGIRYVYWKPGASWYRTPFNIIQNNKPTIVLAEDSEYQIYVYFTIFPSADLLPDCTVNAPASVMQQAVPTREERLAKRVNGGCGCGKRTQPMIGHAPKT